MRTTTRISNTLLLKLARLAVHAEELLSPDGCEADKSAILGLLGDSEVRTLLDDKANAFLLPVKRTMT